MKSLTFDQDGPIQMIPCANGPTVVTAHRIDESTKDDSNLIFEHYVTKAKKL